MSYVKFIYGEHNDEHLIDCSVDGLRLLITRLQSAIERYNGSGKIELDINDIIGGIENEEEQMVIFSSFQVDNSNHKPFLRFVATADDDGYVQGNIAGYSRYCAALAKSLNEYSNAEEMLELDIGEVLINGSSDELDCMDLNKLILRKGTT